MSEAKQLLDLLSVSDVGLEILTYLKSWEVFRVSVTSSSAMRQVEMLEQVERGLLWKLLLKSETGICWTEVKEFGALHVGEDGSVGLESGFDGTAKLAFRMIRTVYWRRKIPASLMRYCKMTVFKAGRAWNMLLRKLSILLGENPVSWFLLKQCELSFTEFGASVASLTANTVPQHVILGLYSVYMFYFGQIDSHPGRDLFGFYEFYDISRSVRFQAPVTKLQEDLVVVGEDLGSLYLRKAIMVQLSTGEVYITDAVDVAGAERFTYKAVADMHVEHTPFAFVDWFAEYADRIHSGYYQLGEASFGTRTRISLFPRQPPAQAVAVTKGVRVSGSCIVQHDPISVRWTYSIRMSIALPGEEGYESPEERGFVHCQLKSRHWKIRIGGAAPQFVHGQAVVGYFPILLPENKHVKAMDMSELDRVEDGEFVYQSCCGDSSLPVDTSGTFEGELEFVPGTLLSPTGPPFRVRVPPIPLHSISSQHFFF